MEILNKEEDIQNHINYAISNDNLELEIIIGSKGKILVFLNKVSSSLTDFLLSKVFQDDTFCLSLQ